MTLFGTSTLKSLLLSSQQQRARAMTDNGIVSLPLKRVPKPDSACGRSTEGEQA